MSQGIWTAINPTQTSGLMLAALLDDFKDAIMTGFAGTSRPPNLQAGGMWVDTTNQAAPNYFWAFKFYNGTEDVEVFRISVLNGFGGTLVADATFTITQEADDAVGPILEMVKQRIANNGQVFSADTVGEIRFTGRTNAPADPVVAYCRWVSSDAQTSSEYGGSFNFFSTPDATNVIDEHMRFIEGMVETTNAQKLNALQLVPEIVPTASDLLLVSDKMVTELTGSTVSTIHGLEALGDSKVHIVHNRSTANVTVKHQSTTADPENRIKLPKSADITLGPEASITLYYCTTESRWKAIATSKSKATARMTDMLDGAWQQYVAPASRLVIHTYRNPGWRMWTLQSGGVQFIDADGNMWNAGTNNDGELGDGTITFRSSPVLVLGGIKWSNKFVSTIALGSASPCSLGLATNGQIYSWGEVGQFAKGATGDGVSRSSPVAIVGGLKFASLVITSQHGWAITEKNDIYSWGRDNNGQCGTGAVNGIVSSPTLVVGGLKWSRLGVTEEDSSVSWYGITTSGDMYAWGFNTQGQLGVGDSGSGSHRSSPVLVLGGHKWKKAAARYTGGGNSGTAFGLTVDGDLYAWGFASSVGYHGLGDTVSRSSPVLVAGGPWKDFWTGGGLQCTFAIDVNGDLYSWGANGDGQLGVGDTTNRSTPTLVLGGIKWKYISVDAQNTNSVFGITEDGDMYAWGNNSQGRLGVAADSVSRSSPVLVVGGHKWEYVTQGSGIYAIKTDGGLYTWGYVFPGQGVPHSLSSPVLIIGPAAPAPNLPTGKFVLDVTAGATYDVVLSQGMSTFGDTALGFFVDYITIQYES